MEWDSILSDKSQNPGGRDYCQESERLSVWSQANPTQCLDYSKLLWIAETLKGGHLWLVDKFTFTDLVKASYNSLKGGSTSN